MSNDKTTLADAQPGGRVRLGDQMPPLPASSTHCQATGEPLFSVAKMKLYAQAVLSAQPSPGGQGDSVRCSKCKDRGYFDVDVDVDDSGGSIGNIEACPHCALAARQPVGEQHADDLAVDAFAAAMKAKMAAARAKGRGGWEDPVQCTADDLSRMLRDHVEKGDPCDVGNFCMMLHQRGEAIAVPQPVGEPVGQVRTRVDGGFIAELLPGVADRVSNLAPLYTAPPAQAVDLGSVRELLQRRVAQWRSHLPADPGAPGTREIETKGEHDYNNDVRIYREGIAVMQEVLALTDSQAVGNG